MVFPRKLAFARWRCDASRVFPNVSGWARVFATVISCYIVSCVKYLLCGMLTECCVPMCTNRTWHAFPWSDPVRLSTVKSLEDAISSLGANQAQCRRKPLIKFNITYFKPQYLRKSRVGHYVLPLNTNRKSYGESSHAIRFELQP